MSLIKVSQKRNRVYRRAFDHEEAQWLRELDPKTWTWERLADRFGVSPTAIQRVCNPRLRERMDANSKRWIRDNCREPCGGGCGTFVWTNKLGRTGLCRACFSKTRARSVRPTELRCGRCHEWKSDEEFYYSRLQKARRGRGSECKPCSAISRREHRQRNPDQERATERKRQMKKGVRVTRFIVFQPNGDGFHEIARVDAVSWTHAIEQVATSVGRYIATPESRFKEADVQAVKAYRVVADGAVDVVRPTTAAVA